MSTPLTDFESTLLRADGEFIVNDTVGLMAESLLWGVYLLLVSFSTYSFCSKGIWNSRPRLAVFFITIFMLVSSTVLLALDAYRCFIQVKGIHLTETRNGETLSDKILSTDRPFYRAGIAKDILFMFEFLIGDTVIMWRTWVLWQDREWAMVIPAIPWIASLGTFFGFFATGATSDANAGRSYITFGSTAWSVELASIVLSISSNALSTAMITYKAWQHRRVIKAALGSSTPATKVEKVLSLLAESGAIYFIVWAVQLGIFVLPDDAVQGYSVELVPFTTFQMLQNQVVGIYPTVIIVLVEVPSRAGRDIEAAIGSQWNSSSHIEWTSYPETEMDAHIRSIRPQVLEEELSDATEEPLEKLSVSATSS